MSVMKKIIVVILTFSVIISMFSVMPNVVCVEAAGNNFQLNAFDGEVASAAGVKNLVNDTAITAISIARVVCVSIAIVILLVIAMKYMMSAPGDRADIKKHAVHYIIGAFILFGVTGILGIINNFALQIK